MIKPFHTIAVPHEDILKGRLTMDVFAADLWDVVQNRGADEYKDAETFFRKTYLTQGLDNLLRVVEKRLHDEGGDPIIQLQTPFGGGKTHALIAMYHKAKEWGAKTIVAVGTVLSPKETLWGLLEKQLTGRIEKCKEPISPGREVIRELLSKNQPVIILMDEVLAYATKASAITVGNSTLAAQTMAFLHELSETVSGLERVSLVVTLPASAIEHYGEGAEKLYQMLQKVAGRVEKIYTPVEENEISKIIRRRLFSRIDAEGVKKIVNEFVDYAEKEDILPPNVQPSEYRRRFQDSYPFMPEVVDVLYQRWGSFLTFQRTRGVLRLLSLVIYDMRESEKPYISLADFNLNHQELRQELLKHIGPEYNGIIANDITGPTSGSKKVDMALGSAYRGLGIGTRTATTIFMYSFSGGQEHGTTLGEIKRSATTLQNPSPLVAEAIEQLKGKLFYLQSRGENYFFSNQANLNRILLNNMENVKESDLVPLEKELIKKSISGRLFRTYIWENKSADIADTEELKLVVLREKNSELIKQLLLNKGQTPRIYRNTLFFLYPLNTERSAFTNMLRRKIALENVNKDKNLNLSEEQRKEVKGELKRIESDIMESVRRLYRLIGIPTRDGFKESDLGIATYGINKKIDEEIFDRLSQDGEILRKIAAIVLREKYLSQQDYVVIAQLYQSMLKTPGEARPVSKGVIEQSIIEGVRMGYFGLGELREGLPVCSYFETTPTISFGNQEILVKQAICEEQKNEKGEEEGIKVKFGTEAGEKRMVGEIGVKEFPSKMEENIRRNITLRFRIPKGKISNIMGIMNLLQSKFNVMEVSISAQDGSISEQDIEDKIGETFRQIGVDFKLE